MRLSQALCIATLGAIGFLCGAPHWLQTAPVRAQQATGSYTDGEIYVYASVNVDSSSNLSVDGSAAVVFDYYEDIDEVEVDGYAEQDYELFDYGYDYDYDYAEVSANYGTVPRGHEYGMESDGYACYDDGDGEDDYECDWEYVGTATAAVYAAAPPPHIDSLSPSSVSQGDQGTLTIDGSNLVENSADQLTINFSGGGTPFTLSSAPSSNSASFTYDFSAVAPGTYAISATNDEGISNSKTFVVNNAPQGPPLDPCAVASTPQVGFTSVVPAGIPGGSGTLGVSFSGPAFAAINASVAYGPHSTPSSIAANIASLITRQYFQSGLSAKAFGPHVIYSGNTSLGVVSNVSTGSSYSTDSTAGAAASAACYSGQPSRYYSLTYKAYIPVDNLPGPSPCDILLHGLDYLGDRSPFSATGYRVQETDIVGTNSSFLLNQPAPHFRPGKTVNFATAFSQYHLMGGGPLAAITVNQFLESPSNVSPNPGSFVYPWEGQCNPPYESNFGYAVLTGGSGTSSSLSANSVKTEFKGLASDPLEPPVGGINWDLTVTINSSNNTALISGWNTCYPAHQIRANGILIFDYQPPTDTTGYLASCLSGADLGLLNPSIKFVTCTVALDGSQGPCMSQ